MAISGEPGIEPLVTPDDDDSWKWALIFSYRSKGIATPVIHDDPALNSAIPSVSIQAVTKEREQLEEQKTQSISSSLQEQVTNPPGLYWTLVTRSRSSSEAPVFRPDFFYSLPPGLCSFLRHRSQDIWYLLKQIFLQVQSVWTAPSSHRNGEALFKGRVCGTWIPLLGFLSSLINFWHSSAYFQEPDEIEYRGFETFLMKDKWKFFILSSKGSQVN